jgi:hypothetical protein
MADTIQKLSVSFDLERRGEEIFFRAAHKPDAVWHGPYEDLAAVTETIAHYIVEDTLEEWFKVSDVMFANIRQALERVSYKKKWIVEKLQDAFVSYTTTVAADDADQAWRIATAYDFGGTWARGDVREYDAIERGEITEVSTAIGSG